MLARFRPRLIGSVRTGHVRKGSDIDIHIFGDSLALVTDTLDETGPPVRRRAQADHQARRGAVFHAHPRLRSESTSS